MVAVVRDNRNLWQGFGTRQDANSMKSQRRPSSHTDPSKLPRPRWKLQGVESRVHQASPPRQSPCPVPVCAQPRGFLPNQPLGVLPLLSASSQLGGDPHATRARPPATPCGIGRSNSSPRARFSTPSRPQIRHRAPNSGVVCADQDLPRGRRAARSQAEGPKRSCGPSTGCHA